MTDALRIEVENLDRVLRALNLAPQIIEDEIGGGTKEALDYLKQQAAIYPPERQNQTYVRTFTLRDGWLNAEPSVQIGRGMVEGEVVNQTPYAHWVQDDELQAAIHRGRWQVVGTIQDRGRTQVERILNVRIERAIKKIEGMA